MFLYSRTNSYATCLPGRALGFVCALYQAPGSTEHCVSAQLGSQVISQSTFEHGDGKDREQEEGDLSSSPPVIQW